MRAAVVRGPPATLERIRLGGGDLSADGRIAALDYQPGDACTVHDLVLAPAEHKT